jgi:hypothetical protein
MRQIDGSLPSYSLVGETLRQFEKVKGKRRLRSEERRKLGKKISSFIKRMRFSLILPKCLLLDTDSSAANLSFQTQRNRIVCTLSI